MTITVTPERLGVRAGRRSAWRARRGIARVVYAVGAVVLVIAFWVLIKHVVPQQGVLVGQTRVLPRTDDGSLPTPLAVARVLSQQNVAVAGSPTVGMTILRAALHTLRLAAGGFAVGVVVGSVFGLLMSRFGFARRALTPYMVVAPTVPILAIAPLVAAWSGKVHLLGWQWQSWASVVAITAYLCVPPVTIGLARGLASPSAQAVELFHCAAATPSQVLLRLRLPAAVPYVVPALKLAAAGAVVSTIVSEISTGTAGGIGRLILDYATEATTDGSRLYAAVIAAALLGMAGTGLVSALDVALGRFQSQGGAR